MPAKQTQHRNSRVWTAGHSAYALQSLSCNNTAAAIVVECSAYWKLASDQVIMHTSWCVKLLSDGSSESVSASNRTR